MKRTNLFKEMPDLIGKMTALKSLDISKNKISELKDVFGELVFLRTCVISLNTISNLPLSLTKCKDMEHFNCSNNQFHSLTPSSSPSSLSSSMDSNLLSSYWPLLNFFSCSQNASLKHLPNFTGLPKLNSLHIRNVGRFFFSNLKFNLLKKKKM